MRFKEKSLTFTILRCWTVNSAALAKDVLKSSVYSTPSLLREFETIVPLLISTEVEHKNTELIYFCAMLHMDSEATGGKKLRGDKP